MRIFALVAIAFTIGCAAWQKPAKPTRLTDLAGFILERPDPDNKGRFIEVTREKFSYPSVVTRGPCDDRRDCLTWVSSQPGRGVRTEVVQDGWRLTLFPYTPNTELAVDMDD